MKYVYLILSILGTILPWAQFGPWLFDNGLAIQLFFEEASSNRIATFAWLDLCVSAAVVLLFVVVEGRRIGVRHLWAPFVAMLIVGVSLALPLFLFFRQLRLEECSNNGFDLVRHPPTLTTGHGSTRRP